MPAVQAQQVQATRLLPPPQNSYNVFVGVSVAISGEWLATSDYVGSHVGEVYLYRRAQEGWLLADTVSGTQSSRFGVSVALDGDLLAVGASNVDGGAVDTGVVAIYGRRGDQWALQQRVHSPAPMAHDLFGWGVAIHGDILAVGAVAEDIPGDNSGGVHIFEQIRGEFEHVHVARLPNVPAVHRRDYASLGASIDIDEDIVVAGAPARLGAALVIEKEGGEWQRTALLTNSTPRPYELFGHSVAVEGDTIVVGEPASELGSPQRGAAFIFERSSVGGWSLVSELGASDGFANANRIDMFGSAVAIRDDVVVVGSFNGRYNGNDTGTVYTFERCAVQAWCETQRLVSTSPEGLSGSLGMSVAIDGGFVVAGAPDTPTDDPYVCGATYIFERPVSVELCPGSVNSTGMSAECAVVGDRGSWVLSGTGLPRGELVVLLASQGHPRPVPAPSGLCLGSAARRPGTVYAGVGGRVFLPLNELRDNGLRRLNFQLWYRDHGTSRFSSAVSAYVP